MRLMYHLFVLIIGLGLLWLNFSIYRQAPTGTETQADVVKQLNFLGEELKHKQLAQRMQALYPEGYVFIYALYGLSWSQLVLNSNLDSSLAQKAIEEAVYAYDQIDSEQGRSVFSSAMSPPYGIYYQGWSNYLMAKLLSTEAPFEMRKKYEAYFSEACQKIAEAFRKHESPFLPSCPGMSWPADSFLAMASLSLHDQIYVPKFQEDIARWLAQVKDRLNEANGMIPHRTTAEDGQNMESPRGGSMALMLRLLAEIDLEMAKAQYELFIKHFKSTALGLPMVREYPKGTWGLGDVDSGPVILGTGFAATIVSIGTHQVFGDHAMAHEQYSIVHAFGISRANGNQRNYLIGALPMADAFIAWSRLAPTMVESRPEKVTIAYSKFHLISAIVFLLIALPWYKRQFVLLIKKAMNKKS